MISGAVHRLCNRRVLLAVVKLVCRNLLLDKVDHHGAKGKEQKRLLLFWMLTIVQVRYL